MNEKQESIIPAELLLPCEEAVWPEGRWFLSSGDVTMEYRNPDKLTEILKCKIIDVIAVHWWEYCVHFDRLDNTSFEIARDLVITIDRKVTRTY